MKHEVLSFTNTHIISILTNHIVDLKVKIEEGELVVKTRELAFKIFGVLGIALCVFYVIVFPFLSENSLILIAVPVVVVWLVVIFCLRTLPFKKDELKRNREWLEKLTNLVNNAKNPFSTIK